MSSISGKEPGSRLSQTGQHILISEVFERGEISPFKWYINMLKGRKEMFYLTMHSTHFIYSYMASDI